MSGVGWLRRVCGSAAMSMAALALFAGGASAADDDGAERTRLAEERRAVDAGFTARDEECRQRFVVSACVSDVRRDRRAALDALRVRQRVLDDARRQQRASERRTALATKAADDAARDRERMAKTASSPSGGAVAAPAASASREGRPLEKRREPRGAKPSRAAKPPKSSSSLRTPASGAQVGAVGGASRAPAKADAATRQRVEARHRATFAARQRDAAQHRDDAATAAIDRMSKRSPAMSLPIPSAPAGGAASAP